MAKKNYKVEILESVGSCDTSLFKKMAENGDITATKIEEYVNQIVKITGYAICHITAGEKEFDMNYYATNDGIISSASSVFKESVLNYLDEDVDLKIIKLRTSKGSTYKVSPILVKEDTEVEEI